MMSSYWENRSVQAMERNKKESLKIIKTVNKNYKVTLKELTSEISQFYAKYNKDRVLEYESFSQKLDDKDFEVMIRDWDSFVKKYPEFSKYRDVRMGYYKLDKMKGLSNRIALHIAKLGKMEEELLSGTLKGTLKKAFNNLSNLFLKKDKLLRKDVEPLSDKRLDEIIKKKWLDGNNFSDRLWKNKAKLQSYLDNELLIDMANGRTYEDIAKRLADRFKVEVFNAERLIHTEMSNIQNQGHLEAIKKAFDKYEIVATLDSKTSNICRGKDGKTYNVDEYKPGITAPPFHPYCRSTIFGSDGDKDNEELKVSTLDLMAKSKEFKTINAVGDDIRFRAKKVQGLEYDIWIQDSTKKIRDTLAMLTDNLRDFNNIPTIVIIKEQKLRGIAGYSYKDDILFISDKLNSAESVKEKLASGYFAAKDFHDILVHELAHKQHWDSAKKLYRMNRKRYNSVEEAKKDLDSELISYVKRQNNFDAMYTLRISSNAANAFHVNNVNELVADVKVLEDKLEDKKLLELVKGMLEK